MDNFLINNYCRAFVFRLDRCHSAKRRPADVTSFNSITLLNIYYTFK